MKAIEWRGDRLIIVDQTRLPHEEAYLELTSYQKVAQAIREMNIRGAPAIGVAAAYGIALGGRQIKTTSPGQFRAELQEVISTIAGTRPTARNLFQATSRMKRIAAAGETVDQIRKALAQEAGKIHAEEEEATGKLS